MDNLCSFNGISLIVCGECRGESVITRLEQCNENIQSHLSSCHLTRSHFKEYELILARAGLFYIPDEEIRSMMICPNHRYNLGRYWRPRLTCQHPSHSGPKRRCKGRDVFNLELSKDISQDFGVLVPVGSRKYKLLLHNIARLLVLPLRMSNDSHTSMIKYFNHKILRFSHMYSMSQNSQRKCGEHANVRREREAASSNFYAQKM